MIHQRPNQTSACGKLKLKIPFKSDSVSRLIIIALITIKRSKLGNSALLLQLFFFEKKILIIIFEKLFSRPFSCKSRSKVKNRFNFFPPTRYLESSIEKKPKMESERFTHGSSSLSHASSLRLHHHNNSKPSIESKPRRLWVDPFFLFHGIMIRVDDTTRW